MPGPYHGEMRFHPWLATGLSLLLASRADAAGPRLQQERHWLFGHRCGVTFEADGPRPWLVPNESFDVEGFASVWSDPLDGTLLLYTDGRDVWRGSDHQRIHQGAAGALGLQPGVVGARPGVGAGKFFLLTAEAPKTRYVLMDLQGVHSDEFLVSSQLPSLAVYARAAADYAAVEFVWTTPVEPYPQWATEGAATYSSTLSVGHQAIEYPPTRNDGPTVSSSWAGERAVFIGLPGHVAVSRATPSTFFFGNLETTHQFDMLDAGDTTGSVHHTMLSPDGTKLYVGIDDGVAGDRADIVQVDLATGTKTLLGRALGLYSPSFGRGPDGVVYVGSAQPDDEIDVLGAITQPNALGAAAGFVPDALPLAAGCDVRRGLTNFVTGGMRLLDTDRDGTWDGPDVDNDQDGILDNTEGGAAFEEGDYEATGLLAWNRAGATTCAVGAGTECATLTAAIDPDADGLPSPDDLDSDGDGLPDLWECGGLGLDLDDDGRVDGPVQTYGGLAVAIATEQGGSTLRCGDADDDGVVNALDLDSDGDGFGDREEANGSTGLDVAQSGWAPAGRAGTRVGMQSDVDDDSVPDWLDAVDDRVQDAGTDADPEGGVDDGGSTEGRRGGRGRGSRCGSGRRRRAGRRRPAGDSGRSEPGAGAGQRRDT